MSSQDSQQLPPLVIAESPLIEQEAQPVGQSSAIDASHDVKPSTGDQQAIATLPVFPKLLPHVEINTLDFEQGFAESCLVGAVGGMSLCTICKGFPRRPVTLDACGHLFCEPCLKMWFETRARPHTTWMAATMTAPCPLCRTHFQKGEILTWDIWQKWAQLSYNAQVVRCPFLCGFEGTASRVDEHQVRECSKRKIDCPVDGCPVRGSAEWIEKEHFQRCPGLQVFCAKCRLPVRAAALSTHNCITRLQEALTGTGQLIHQIFFCIYVQGTDEHSFFVYLF